MPPASSALAPGDDPRAETRAETLARLRAQLASAMPSVAMPTVEPVLPVHPVLAELLPGGGLRPGSIYSVASGGLLLLSLVAGVSQTGAWCAAVGMPELGAEAAAQAGVELSRLVLVPHPGDRWLAATAAVAEVMHLIAVRPGDRLRPTDAARLAARLRDRGAVLLVAGTWPQAEAVLSLTETRWSGLEGGYGYLDRREALVTVSSKRTPRPRSARIMLPDSTGGLATPGREQPGREQPGGERSPLRAVG